MITNKILIPSVCTIAVFCAAGAYFMPFSPRGAESVEIYREGVLFESVRLSDIKDTKTVVLDTNTVCIDSDGVYMKSASCPDKLCVRQGKISRSGQSIVCLPNRIEVRIEGSKGEVDAVAGAR